LLLRAGLIDVEMTQLLQARVGFRNIAIHDDQDLQLPILQSIGENNLGDFIRFTDNILSVN
jgi:uncharacterized protein YutE (UPF0331/DUF86 family)